MGKSNQQKVKSFLIFVIAFGAIFSSQGLPYQGLVKEKPGAKRQGLPYDYGGPMTPETPSNPYTSTQANAYSPDPASPSVQDTYPTSIDQDTSYSAQQSSDNSKASPSSTTLAVDQQSTSSNQSSTAQESTPLQYSDSQSNTTAPAKADISMQASSPYATSTLSNQDQPSSTAQAPATLQYANSQNNTATLATADTSAQMSSSQQLTSPQQGQLSSAVQASAPSQYADSKNITVAPATASANQQPTPSQQNIPSSPAQAPALSQYADSQNNATAPAAADTNTQMSSSHAPRADQQPTSSEQNQPGSAVQAVTPSNHADSQNSTAGQSTVNVDQSQTASYVSSSPAHYTPLSGSIPVQQPLSPSDNQSTSSLYTKSDQTTARSNNPQASYQRNEAQNYPVSYQTNTTTPANQGTYQTTDTEHSNPQLSSPDYQPYELVNVTSKTVPNPQADYQANSSPTVNLPASSLSALGLPANGTEYKASIRQGENSSSPVMLTSNEAASIADSASPNGAKKYPSVNKETTVSGNHATTYLELPKVLHKPAIVKYQVQIAPKTKGVPIEQEIAIMPAEGMRGERKPLVLLKQTVSKPTEERIQIIVPKDDAGLVSTPKVEVKGGHVDQEDVPNANDALGNSAQGQWAAPGGQPQGQGQLEALGQTQVYHQGESPSQTAPAQTQDKEQGQVQSQSHGQTQGQLLGQGQFQNQRQGAAPGQGQTQGQGPSQDQSQSQGQPQYQLQDQIQAESQGQPQYQEQSRVAAQGLVEPEDLGCRDLQTCSHYNPSICDQQWMRRHCKKMCGLCSSQEASSSPSPSSETSPPKHCEYGGVVHQSGETWSPGPCVPKCQCINGAVNCSKVECPDLNCDKPVKRRWKCCPECLRNFQNETRCGVETRGGNGEHLCCVFPFNYRGVDYFTCTTFDSAEPWCSITRNYDRDGLWGNCVVKAEVPANHSKEADSDEKSALLLAKQLSNARKWRNSTNNQVSDTLKSLPSPLSQNSSDELASQDISQAYKADEAYKSSFKTRSHDSNIKSRNFSNDNRSETSANELAKSSGFDNLFSKGNHASSTFYDRSSSSPTSFSTYNRKQVYPSPESHENNTSLPTSSLASDQQVWEPTGASQGSNTSPVTSSSTLNDQLYSRPGAQEDSSSSATSSGSFDQQQPSPNAAGQQSDSSSMASHDTQQVYPSPAAQENNTSSSMSPGQQVYPSPAVQENNTPLPASWRATSYEQQTFDPSLNPQENTTSLSTSSSTPYDRQQAFTNEQSSADNQSFTSKPVASYAGDGSSASSNGKMSKAESDSSSSNNYSSTGTAADTTDNVVPTGIENQTSYEMHPDASTAQYGNNQPTTS